MLFSQYWRSLYTICGQTLTTVNYSVRQGLLCSALQDADYPLTLFLENSIVYSLSVLFLLIAYSDGYAPPSPDIFSVFTIAGAYTSKLTVRGVIAFYTSAICSSSRIEPRFFIRVKRTAVYNFPNRCQNEDLHLLSCHVHKMLCSTFLDLAVHNRFDNWSPRDPALGPTSGLEPLVFKSIYTTGQWLVGESNPSA